MEDVHKRAVVGIDVGFRTGGWVRLEEDGAITWGVFATPAPPPRKVRVAGELAIADDVATQSLLQQVCDVIGARGVCGVVYECPTKAQGSRALETLAFARAAIVCACKVEQRPFARVTPDESELCLHGPRQEPRLPNLSAGKNPTPAQQEALAAAKKARNREKEQRRKARKEATCEAIARIFPELRGIRDATSDWSHVCDAAAVLLAEASVGQFVRGIIPIETLKRLQPAKPPKDWELST